MAKMITAIQFIKVAALHGSGSNDSWSGQCLLCNMGEHIEVMQGHRELLLLYYASLSHFPEIMLFLNNLYLIYRYCAIFQMTTLGATGVEHNLRQGSLMLRNDTKINCGREKNVLFYIITSTLQFTNG